LRHEGADTEAVDAVMESDIDSGSREDVEFFGVKLKVSNPRLAALLNSSVSEDVQVIGKRARDVFAVDPVEIDRDGTVDVDLGTADDQDDRPV
jgi:hypothetical protein